MLTAFMAGIMKTFTSLGGRLTSAFHFDRIKGRVTFLNSHTKDYSSHPVPWMGDYTSRHTIRCLSPTPDPTDGCSGGDPSAFCAPAC